MTRYLACQLAKKHEEPCRDYPCGGATAAWGEKLQNIAKLPRKQVCRALLSIEIYSLAIKK